MTTPKPSAPGNNVLLCLCPKCGSEQPVVRGRVKAHKAQIRNWPYTEHRCSGGTMPAGPAVEAWVQKKEALADTDARLRTEYAARVESSFAEAREAYERGLARVAQAQKDAQVIAAAIAEYRQTHPKPTASS